MSKIEKYFKDDTTIVPVYVFEADGVTPAPVGDVTWEYVDPEDDTLVTIHVTNPTTGPTLAQGASGTMSGVYDYVYSNIDTAGFESATSPASSITVTSKKVNVTLPDAPAGISGRNIYRKKQGNDVFRLVSSVGTATATFIDDELNDDDMEFRTPVLAYGNTMAKFMAPADYFDTDGHYLVAGKFSLLNGTTRTSRLSFQIVDPLAVSVTEVDKTIDLAWLMFSDCFDSVDGGPWLQDKTKDQFDEEKFATFFDLALFGINQVQPPGQYTPESFPYDTARPLIAKAMMLEAIKHLMRSYVEQPQPINNPTMRLERRDYLERWRQLYDLEKAEFDRLVLLFKRDQYGFGQTAMLVSGQSGLRTPRVLRTRYPRFAGGWWGRW